MSHDEHGPNIRRSLWVKSQRDTVAAYFAKKKKISILHKEYILADSKAWEGNLLDQSLKTWLLDLKAQKQKKGIRFPIHRWIHHGLSSQALLINMVGPLIRDRKWRVFDQVLESARLLVTGKVTSVDLEYEDRSVFNEDQGQPTSFDLVCVTDAGEQIFVEFKYTEREFGGCSVFYDGDCDGANAADKHDLCYLHEIKKRLYWKLMDRHKLTDTIRSEATCPLAQFYQAYRELLFALESGGKYLLIYDSRNGAFTSGADSERGLWPRFRSKLPDHVLAKTSGITIQQVADVLEEAGCGWIAELREKHDLRPLNAA